MKLPAALRVANEGLAFLLELAALAALAWWGWEATENTAPRLLLAVAAPALAAVVWGLFAAPKARFRVPLAAVLLVKALVFGTAALAPAGLGRPAWALTFAAVTLANTTLATADKRTATRGVSSVRGVLRAGPGGRRTRRGVA
ncbi:YrdB family protein [Streptomyces sp. SP18ES09]|uniref:YrdB family protein n=1 Tax=Streptomyces sp. SP18ES09 TaxID=3002532 RepID=UPI002E77796E|nr:YrdB family protein [Streptomyces sp. SP18ES09]MEE1816094.1 YrdB family protein [Streptomyces sp. SP18ES09]